MPARRELTMRQIRHMLRLARDGVSAREIGRTLGIARDMRLARATVRKYAAADAFPARLPHGQGPSLLDPHVDYLLGRILGIAGADATGLG